jgi:hypothetical protein
MFSGKLIGVLRVFPSRRIYRRKGGVRRWARWPHHLVAWVRGWPRHRIVWLAPGSLMTHKYRGCIVVLLINKSVKPNEEQKVLMSSFDQGFTVNTSKRVFRGIW